MSSALPLLLHAKAVTVVQLATADELGNARSCIDDVVAWLARRGVKAEGLAELSTGDDAAAL